jgi:hypothetical protein
MFNFLCLTRTFPSSANLIVLLFEAVLSIKSRVKNSSRKILAAAAIAGLLSGVSIQQGRADSATNSIPGKVAPEKKAPKAHGCAGQNDCKGIGGCKTDGHDCKFKNACKGKGGCEITAKDIANWQKAQNTPKNSK